MSLYGKVNKAGYWLSRDQVRRWESKVEGSVYGWAQGCDTTEDYIGTVVPNLGMSNNRRRRDYAAGRTKSTTSSSSWGEGSEDILTCEVNEMNDYKYLPSNAISRNCENTREIAKKRGGKVKQDSWDFFGGMESGRY